MSRIRSALGEWLELRARLREECRFHLDRAEADFRCLGLSRHAAKKAARARFGSRHNLRVALREIGGDAAGLGRLLRTHRILGSTWVQPFLLLAVMPVALLMSPAPGILVGSLIGQPLSAESRQTVFFSVEAPWPLFTGINAKEFEALRSLPGLTDVERCRTIYVLARLHGASLAAVKDQARARTGNPGIRAASLFDLRRIEMSPAMPVWVLIVFFAFLSVHVPVSHSGNRRWLFYALFTGSLHFLASMTIWALANQICQETSWPTKLAEGFGFSSLLVSHMLLAVLQYRCWSRDLSRRCPVCLEQLLLASTEGSGERLLVGTAITESVCSHGHGVLVETRWTRQFRREYSQLEGLVRV